MNYLHSRLASIRNFIFFLMVLSTTTLAAPLNNFNSKCFTSDDGLPQDSVTDIAFASNGQLIVSTFSGIRAFNGQDFSTYVPKADIEFPQVESYIVKTSENGIIFIGSTTNGLYQINKNHIQHWDKNNGLQNNNIESIVIIDNDVYIKNGDLLFLIDTNKSNVLTAIDPPLGLDSDNFTLFSVDNTLIVATHTSLWKRQNKQWIAFDVYLNEQKISGISYGLRNNGNIFFIESANKLYLVNNNAAQLYLTEFRKDKSIIINAIMLDKQNNLWIATENHGLIRYSQEYGIETLFSTIGHRTVSVTQDNDGIIWFGGSDGLCFLKENLIRNIGKQQGLIKENIRYLNVDNKDTIYALNQDSQKGFYSIKNDTIKLHSIDSQQLDNDETIYALAHDGKDIWIATENKIAKLSGDSLEALRLLDKKSRVLLAKDNTIWFVDKDHLISYHTQSSQFNQFFITNNSEIYAMDFAINGDILLAEKNNTYRLSNGSIKKIQMPLAYSSCIHEFRKDELWVCGEGLWLKTKNKTYYFDEKQGLTHGHVHDVIEDDMGNIWVITNAGLFQISRDEISALEQIDDPVSHKNIFTKFTEKDGMKSSEFNGSAYAAVKTSDGKLWFASQKGIVVVNPTFKDIQESKILTPFIEHMYIGNNRIPQSEWTNIQPNPQTIHVHFSTVFLTGTRNISYRYKLDNLHASWLKGNVLDLANLKPNQYTLRVQAKLNNNNWSNELTTEINILPAWYQTFWFRLVSTILIAIAVFGIPLWRIQWLKKSAKKLTNLVDLQTKSLTDANLKLEKLAHFDQLTGIANRREFFNYFTRIKDLSGDIHLALIDVDDFKAYNDFYGHIKGDECLKQIAQTLDSFSTEHCFVARFGGEEFVILFNGIFFNEAQQQCQQLITEIDCKKIPHQKSTIKNHISLSIGLTTFKVNESIEALIDRADNAMYQAKTSGKNRLIII